MSQCAGSAPGIRRYFAVLEVRRHRREGSGWDSRFWALYLDGELLAVTVYRKGALAVAERLRRLAGAAGADAREVA